jgi:outer membrane protein OmpA-like peptidoglycan-associated protein
MRRAPVWAAILLALAACAEDGGRTFGGLFGNSTPPEAEPPAAEGRPYPNLATVPRRPRDPPEAKAQREADLERLTRDRDKALSDDRVLRDTGAMPPPAPETPSEAPKATAAAPVPSASATPAPAPSPTPSAPAVPASAVAPAAVSVQRVGSVSFARDAASLTAAAQRSLAEAAALARPGNGRVRLVAAQTARQPASVGLDSARLHAITQALAAAGLPATRVTIDDALGRRIDLYDIYVER